MHTAHSPNLDLLRAYAVLTVYFGHLFLTFQVEYITSRFMVYDFAQTGVLFFFVHTCLVLLQSIDRGQTPPLAFYIRRIFRIYPLSILTVFAMLAFQIPAFPARPYAFPGLPAVLSNLALTQNLTRSEPYPSVLWSLPYEVQMYLALPLLYWALRRYPSRWFPLALWGGAIVLILGLQQLHVRGLPTLLQFTPCFLGGAIAFRLWREPLAKWPAWLWPFAITACIGFRVFASTQEIPGGIQVSTWVNCLLLGLAAPRFHESTSVLLNRLTAAIAKYSYGVYLTHCAVFWLAFVHLPTWPIWAQAILCLSLSMALPFALYHAVEAPLIHLGARLARALAA